MKNSRLPQCPFCYSPQETNGYYRRNKPANFFTCGTFLVPAGEAVRSDLCSRNLVRLQWKAVTALAQMYHMLLEEIYPSAALPTSLELERTWYNNTENLRFGKEITPTPISLADKTLSEGLRELLGFFSLRGVNVPALSLAKDRVLQCTAQNPEVQPP